MTMHPTRVLITAKLVSTAALAAGLTTLALGGLAFIDIADLEVPTPQVTACERRMPVVEFHSGGWQRLMLAQPCSRRNAGGVAHR